MTAKVMARKDYSLRCNFPYSTGLYLALNAVPDAYLLIDGPSCSFHKGELIYGNHDLCSTLLDASGNHRICNTDASALNIMSKRVPVIIERLSALRRHPDAGIVLLAALPMASIVGTQYEAIVESLGTPEGARVLVVPPDPFDGDWLEGYAAVLQVLAENVDLQGGRQEPRNVAVVGYFMDRSEADHMANLGEMRSMLRELSLNPVSIWLSHASFRQDLSRIRDAGTIVSLPYGRAAARILAQRLNAALVETDVPFGLSGTQRWLMQIAEACGCRREAERLIDRRLSSAVHALKWIVSNFLLHKRIAYVGDPHLYRGLLEMSCDFGFEICSAVLVCKESCAQQPADRRTGPEPLFEPTLDGACKALKGVLKSGPIDLVITNSYHLIIAKILDLPFLEFGFPNYFSHRLYDSPFLCFSGCLKFLEDTANRLTLFDALSLEQVVRVRSIEEDRRASRKLKRNGKKRG
jgi:nitrogenase molybdenum-iron protein alpha/beta subunit